ncbi:M56 family metallopeptidase [Fimbriiglobus ruber]|uniref:Regulatory sensor-transducer, BlaR1/MecR1 family n=1 Tax=Fimbriiglobus ruber TaxID=1908690 RepID=A0A225DEK3_9BACT|nr:M56 family metallopeptidase [Fimbriiglobus ruber]OWK35579.1 Regulatory sensor-transducer, BlaR1/MecR1 family [Fimbriiglobus ruber]
MTDTPTTLDTVLTWVAHASWQAAVLGLLVAVLSRVLRGRLEPRWHFCLWLVVLARLALPVTPPAPWSLFRLAGVAAPKQAPIASSVTATVIDSPVVATPDPPFAPDISPTISREANAEGLPVPPSGEETVRETSTSIPGETGKWVAAVWLAGLLLLMTRQGWLSYQFRRQRGTWRDADSAVLDLFRRCQAELGIARSVQLLIAPGRHGPATWGMFRAGVVLPADLPARLSPGELRLVLQHELIHVCRRDVLFDRVATILAAVHWFNPFAWLTLAGLRRERELACDAAVLRQIGDGEAGRYGHALLAVAERLTAAATTSMVGVVGRNQSLDRRIRMIANYRAPTAARTALGGLLLVMLVALGLTDAAGEPPPAPAPDRPASAAPPGKENRTVTLTGVCEDDTGKPLPGVRVVLYRYDWTNLKDEKIHDQVTGNDGRFSFPDVPALPADELTNWGYLLAATSAGRGSVVEYLQPQALKGPPRLRLGPAAALQGRVTDIAGKPVAGARVWGSFTNSPIEGVRSTWTDANGRYAITDMTAWGSDATKPQPAGAGMGMAVSGCFFHVHHPDYARAMPMYRGMPAAVDVVLKPAAVIEGRVMDRVTGRPAGGVHVELQPAMDRPDRYPEGAETRTDAEGHYRFASMPAGKYALWADAPDRTCVTPDLMTIEAGKSHTAPVIELIEGGWIEGHVVAADTGKPVSGASNRDRLSVAVCGSARPEAGSRMISTPVDVRGRFSVRVPPGLNFPSLTKTDYWYRTQRREYFEKGIEVKAGEVTSVVFRILPAKPLPDPDPAPVRLPIPVPAERQAAALIRQLGGGTRSTWAAT